MSGGKSGFVLACAALALSSCDQQGMARLGATTAICPPTRSAELIPFLRSAASPTLSLTFDDLKQRIDARCSACHLGMTTGGFQYIDQYSNAAPPGLKEAIDRMTPRVVADTMPPGDSQPEATRVLGKIMQAWIAAGKPNGPFTANISSGTTVAAGNFPRLPPDQAEGMTNIGGCIPLPTSIVPLMSPDDAKDTLFANATTLPNDLSDTDFTTFDSVELVKHGVIPYAPTYQLWSDDAHKLRLVRVPKGQKITFDPVTRKFHIPPNTRFYKTFFKRVVEPDGHIGYRAIETRLIVSRPAVNDVQQAIFGTYLWDESQTKATLWDGAYRDGTPFRDNIFTYTDRFDNCQLDANGNVVTDASGSPKCDAHQRTYAIPAHHRCIQCHEGAQAQNFVLGFTPLQVNRRQMGQGGVIGPVAPDELQQVSRLIAYGVLDVPGGAASLPVLETSAGTRMPRNEYELQAQAYMTANCAHCHNPKGFPVRDNPALLPFDLSPGGIVFQFPVSMAPQSTQLANLVNPLNLNLDDSGCSLIYRRVATPVTSVWTNPNNLNDPTHLVVNHMPANTPGLDCRAPDILGRWIASIPVDVGGRELPPDALPAQVQEAQLEASLRVSGFSANCQPPDDVNNFISEDYTEPKTYTPRRADFNTWTPSEDVIDPFVHPELIHGIPKLFRDLPVDDSFGNLSSTPVPSGYWTWKKACHFPADLPPNPSDPNDHKFYSRPWMYTADGQPRRPLGEVYLASPGAAIFIAVCSNCHGARADGNSANAKALLQLTNGELRVANLMQGLFGPQNDPTRPIGSNLPLFDQPGTSGQSFGPFGAAKYLAWMISGGTDVKFPAGFESLLGSGDKTFGGNMGTKIAYICSRVLPPGLWPYGSLNGDPFQNGIPPEQLELWTAVCGYRNQPIPVDAAHIPPNFDRDGFLRTAQFNGARVMYFFFRDQASHGKFPANANSCDLVYGAAQ